MCTDTDLDIDSLASVEKNENEQVLVLQIIQNPLVFPFIPFLSLISHLFCLLKESHFFSRLISHNCCHLQIVWLDKKTFTKEGNVFVYVIEIDYRYNDYSRKKYNTFISKLQNQSNNMKLHNQNRQPRVVLFPY